MNKKIADQFSSPGLGVTGIAPAKKSSKKRAPILWLIDTSGSTAQHPDPDIDHINAAIAQLLDTLRVPPHGSDLEMKIDHIDLCIVVYANNATTILPWTPAPNLPPSIPPLTGAGVTSTAKAFDYILDEIANYLRDLKRQHIAWYEPVIIHMTDGGMNDAKPGDSLWNSVHSRLQNVLGTSGAEARQHVGIFNFISPKGSRNGAAGMALMDQLCGSNTVRELSSGAQGFANLVKFITALATNITKNYGAAQAGSNAAGETGFKGPITVNNLKTQIEP